MYADPRHRNDEQFVVRLTEQNNRRVEELALKYGKQKAAFVRSLLEAAIELEQETGKLNQLLNI